MYVAWGDESGSDARLDPGTYLMAVAVGEAHVVPHVREQMRGLLLRGQRKVHWRDESHDRRLKLVDAIADLPVEGFVVVRVAGEADRPERRRRKCLETLFRELSVLECGELVLESRGPADDRRDREMLEHLRRRRSLTAPLRLFHEPGPSEPMLWIPDVLCGAVGHSRTGAGEYLERLASRVTVHLVRADHQGEK
ncbi:hypothetical protein GT755_26085 [Herbidospora sp. NEAU-GS84]|uniref:DUF3800 domain-containing protein n=1 Tax=Herbidospora solisilvae TaxID=2696284 RepID=A0A7C9J6H4_9ACTN|nr:hypothetical protein [Herbidospora solisilvae]NAS25140.1 hypothetical protein [Herbidospora solisilvae]